MLNTAGAARRYVRQGGKIALSGVLEGKQAAQVCVCARSPACMRAFVCVCVCARARMRAFVRHGWVAGWMAGCLTD